jgi:large subunit ribosomal protein L14e
MISVGQVCIKTAGREKGSVCVIVEVKDDNYVTIDGNVKRRRCSISHLSVLPQKIKVKKSAPTKEVKEELAKAGFEVMQERKSKKPTEKPQKKRKSAEKGAKKKAESTSKPKSEEKKSRTKAAKKPAKAKSSEKKTAKKKRTES